MDTIADIFTAIAIVMGTGLFWLAVAFGCLLIITLAWELLKWLLPVLVALLVLLQIGVIH